MNSDPNVAGGGVFYKLLMRALPSYYVGNSIYAMFPFVHPQRTKEVLTKLGKAGEYDFSIPRLRPQPQSIKTYNGVASVLNDSAVFKVPCEFSDYLLA